MIERLEAEINNLKAEKVSANHLNGVNGDFSDINSGEFICFIAFVCFDITYTPPKYLGVPNKKVLKKPGTWNFSHRGYLICLGVSVFSQVG